MPGSEQFHHMFTLFTSSRLPTCCIVVCDTWFAQTSSVCKPTARPVVKLFHLYNLHCYLIFEFILLLDGSISPWYEYDISEAMDHFQKTHKATWDFLGAQFEDQKPCPHPRSKPPKRHLWGHRSRSFHQHLGICQAELRWLQANDNIWRKLHRSEGFRCYHPTIWPKLATIVKYDLPKRIADVLTSWSWVSTQTTRGSQPTLGFSSSSSSCARICFPSKNKQHASLSYNYSISTV